MRNTARTPRGTRRRHGSTIRSPGSGCAGACLVLAALIGLGHAAHGQEETTGCEVRVAEFLAVQGDVEVRRSEASGWQTAREGLWLCSGDAVRTSTFGQALVRLPDNTLLNLDANTHATFGEDTSQDRGTLVELLRGLIHVISRDPRSLRFDTPYVNAGLEGTEFTVLVAEGRTEIEVIEGEVALESAFGRASVPPGAIGIATAAAPPEIRVDAEPLRKLDWTDFFPQILREEVDANAEPGATRSNDAAFYTARAAARLRIGLPDLARQDIERALAIEPDNAEAFALRAVIALAGNDLDLALNQIEAAERRDPASVPALLAHCYVEQRRNRLAEAMRLADAAVELSGGDHLAIERKAELLVAIGDAESAIALAEQALAQDPSHARSHAIIGFAHLAAGRVTLAVSSFLDAIERDSALPLARLGLALAYTRNGDIGAGREQFEIAVSLAPRNAVIRSYMARSYETEHRTPLSATLIDIARTLDPKDPTPWLQSALQSQQANAAVEALWAYEAATNRASGEPVFRSSFALDEDLATRSAGVARLYRQLGFDRLALLHGFNAIAANPSDHAGHRLLADMNSTLPRFQTARVNEYFKAQLLQPLNVVPVQPHFGEANLFVVDLMGPSDLATTDLGAPISYEGFRTHASAITGGNDTDGIEFAVARTGDRIALSAGVLDFATDGFRPNNDFDQRVAQALVQYRPRQETSLLFELRSLEIDRGDIGLLFDRQNYRPSLRATEEMDSLRAGLRHAFSPRNTLVGFVSLAQVDNLLASGSAFTSAGDIPHHAVDVQNVRTGSRWQIVSGLRHAWRSKETVSTTSLPNPLTGTLSTFVNTTRTDEKLSLLYAYASRSLGERLRLTAGLEGIELSDVRVAESATNPKLGLEWRVTPNTQLRFSALETVHGPGISKFVIEPTLSPTYVAGFNQEYFGATGEKARQLGFAIDHAFSKELYTGLELVERDLSVPFAVLDPATGTLQSLKLPRNELTQRAYLYWTPSARLAIAGEYQRDEFDNAGFAFFEDYALLETRRLPLTISFFYHPRLSTRLRATYIDQTGTFLERGAGPAASLAPGHDAFWVLDLESTYRLRNRRGILSLAAANLSNESFRFQDADAENPRIMPERLLAFRFTLAF